VSPKTDSYAGNGSGIAIDTFGFSSNHASNALGGGVFEIICGQDPAALASGATILARAVPGGALRNCCMRSDGSTESSAARPSRLTLRQAEVYFGVYRRHFD
jgi:hypothetical protein